MNKEPSNILNKLRRHRRVPNTCLCALVSMWQICQPLQAATLYWDADADATGNNLDGTALGGTGSWDTSLLNWWNASSLVAWPAASTDTAVFSGAFPTLGIPAAKTVTLSNGISANQLIFNRSGYTLTGGDLTLAGTSPGFYVQMGETVDMATQILGSAGLVKSGGGSLRLSNGGNNYSGLTTVANGSLIISSMGALGSETSAVSVLTTNSTPQNANLIGFGGGTLVLDGSGAGFGAGFDFDRNLNLEGRGSSGNGAALISIGDNNLTGTVTASYSPQAFTFRTTRIIAVDGTLNFSNALTTQGTTGTTFTSLGGANTAGANVYKITAVVSGSGSIEKAGAGTLLWEPTSLSGFTGTLRISASAAGSQSTVRVTSLSVGGTSIFGANVGTGASGAIDINGGVLEIRNEASLNFGALSTGKNVYNRSSSTAYTGPGVGGQGINGVTTFGTLQQVINTTTTFNSRNGYGMTLSTVGIDASTSTTTQTNSLTNNMGGNLTFTGNITLGEGNTASRPRVLAVGGNGNTVFQGSVIAGTDAGKTMTKSGSGNLTILGTASTLAGAISITAGAITATDFRSLTNNTANISLGNATTTGGNLIIGTSTAATAAGLTTSRPIVLNTTSGSNSIYANQSGANPVILNGAISKIAAASTGALILGGTNTADNIINVLIPVETTPSTGGVTKLGLGTWVLNAANTYLGATTIQGGTLKLRATAGASDVIKEAASNTVVFSANATTGTAAGILEFRGVANTASTETLGALTPTAGDAKIVLLGNGTGAANLTFTSLGATAAASSVNFTTTSSNGGVVTLTGQAATTATNLPGTANFQGHLYINGADFATINASAQVVAPTYGASGNFQNASTALVASVHNKLTGSFNSAAAATISSLVTNSQTLGLGGNLTISTGAILQSGGTATIQSSDGLTARTIVGGAAGTNVAIRVNGSTDVLNLGTALAPLISISSTTTGGLTKNGAGTLVIYGGNSQTGTTTINEGTVKLSGSSSRLSAITAGLVVRQGAKLQLDGITTANAVVAALDGAGIISNENASAATFTQTGAGTWNGVFQNGVGVLNVTKGLTGAPTWSGLNTYTGVTTIGGTTGSVTVDSMADGGSPSGIGASTSDAANLVFAGTTAGIIYRGSIIEGALTLGSRSATTNRLFTLMGTGATISSTASNNNAIIWSNTGAIVHGVTGPQSLILTGSSTGDNTFNLQITDSGTVANITSLSKTDVGQWNLGNSNNTYTGATTISNGILALNNNGALPANSPLALGTAATSGTFQMSGTFERPLASAATAGSGTVTWTGTTGGGGFAAHSTPLVVAIGGIGNLTALTWNSGGFVPTGAPLLLNSASALSDVLFMNNIDLGAAQRTITVNDNTNTATDYATLSGVLSGTGGGIIKNGGGILRLTGANTYTGVTDVSVGTLVAWSLGSSSDPANTATSVGLSGVTMNDTNAITIGNAGTGGAILQYVGPGETSDRKIRMNSTTGGAQIHADGSGPLILTNLVNDYTTPTGAKTLSLRGTSTAGNMITSQLTNDAGGGALSVTIDGSATWILTNPANSYTGTTTVSAGALGIGHNTAIPGALTLSNGVAFAYGGDRTLTNTLTLGNNATSGFVGDYSLTFTGSNILGASVNNANLYNSIVDGKSLTFEGGLKADSLSANRTWSIDGSGLTIINGDFTTTTAFGVGITKTGNGKLVLGRSSALGSNFNQGAANFDLDRGTLSFNQSNAFPAFGAAAPTATADVSSTVYTVSSTAGLQVGQLFTGTNVPVGSRIVSIDGPNQFTANLAPSTAVTSTTALTFTASGGLTLSPEVLTTDTATVDLNGTTQTVNAFTATTDGSVVIDNTSASAASFRFGANNSAVTFGTGIGTYTVQNTGAGALSLVKLGNATATLPSGITLSHKGETASEGGGILSIASPVGATTGLRAIEASTLALTGGLDHPELITSVEVGGGSTLSLIDGAGSSISNLSTLKLGASGTGTVTLNLNVGDGATDTLTLLTGGTGLLGNTITFNMTDAGLSGDTTYTLLDLKDGGLNAFGFANLLQGGTPGGFTSMTWLVDDNTVKLKTGLLIEGDLYWRGLTNNTWNGNANNWATDKSGSPAAGSIPGAGNNVIFAYDNIGTGALTTALEQNFRINSLVFEPGVTTPASVTINPGSVSTNRLDLAPQTSNNGINVKTGAPAAITVATNVRLGRNQTWTVADATSVLTMSGALQGEANLTIAGAGKVSLTGAADPLFNAGSTAVFTVSTGSTLEVTNAGGLGTSANANLASLVLNGAFYYNNATAGTIPNPMTLSGGILSAAGNGQTYSGAINLSADSTLNMRDSNSATLTTTQRNITLSGVLSGAGKMTVDSINTASFGNQLTGTLVLSAANPSWSGGINVLRGTVDLRQESSIGTGPARVETGRFLFKGATNTVWNQFGGGLTVDATTGTALVELQADNQGTTGLFTTNFNGQVNLGGGGASTAVLRLYQADSISNLTIDGSIVLGSNGIIHNSGATAGTQVNSINGIISESGGSFSLGINSDTTWGSNNYQVLQLNSANTYTGGTILGGGTVRLGILGALSTGPITVSGASNLNSLVDLTGGNALSNALNLAAVLTLSGTNGVSFSNTATNTGAGGITNSLTAANVTLAQLNLADLAAVAARTFTVAGAGTGATSITAVLNSYQNNILNNNLSAANLAIGSIALSESAGTGRTLTLGGSGTTVVSGVIEDVLGGGGTAGSLNKAGTGLLSLEGSNTFTGPVTVTAGTLQFSTVSDIGGPASNLGQGSSIALAGGTLRFIGGISQTSNRTISTTASSTLAANGTGGATITYAGAISQATDNSLTLSGTGEGLITGGITQPAGAASADLVVSSGIWTISGASSSIADDLLINGGTVNLQNTSFALNDDIVVSNAGTVFNLNTTGVWNTVNPAGTSSYLFVRGGAIANFNADDVNGVNNANGVEGILLGDGTTAGTGTLQTNGKNISVPRLDIGGITAGFDGALLGSGTVNVTSTATDYNTGIRLFRGTVAAKLAGVSTILKQGLGDATLSGDNTGLTATVAATRLDSGNLILDYTSNNLAKISTVAGLDMRGATLTINGNAGAATSQSVTSTTFASGGYNTISVNNGAGQTATLSLGAITRAASAGVLRINLSGTSAFVTTTTVNGAQGLVGAGAWATVKDPTGTYFATRDASNNIVGLASTVKNDVTTWATGDHVSNDAAFTESVSLGNINSLRFNAAAGSSLNIASTGALHIASGGVLITDQVTSGTSGIFGGTLLSGVSELIITQDSSTLFEISSVIAGANAITKTGNGILKLSGNNPFTGQLQIMGGTLQVTGGNAIGDTSLVTLADDRVNTLTLLGNETIGRLTGGSSTTGIETLATVAIGTNTLTLNTAGGSVTYAGMLTGSGAIVKSGGTSNQAFSNISTGFTGTVTVNTGLFQLTGIGQINASAFTINGAGNLLIDNNGTTRSGTRILDTTPILMNSASGTFAGETMPRGLAIRINQNATTNETIGTLNFVSGNNWLTGEASGTTGVAALIADNFIRSNNATVNVRGRALGLTTGDRNQFRIGTTANETAWLAAPGNLVGGGGTIGTTIKNVSIVPWAVGENLSASVAASNMGNTFVSYVTGRGFVPLSLANEFSVFSTMAVGDNVRETVTATNLSGLVSTSVNSLIINNDNTANSSVSVTGAGAGQTLTNTSGAFLFTLNSAAVASSVHSISLGGFDAGIAIGATGEYIFNVINPSSAATAPLLTATIASPLTTAAHIVKSGRGALVLSSVNTAGGGVSRTVLNEGTLEIADLDNIGGNTGALVFAGGALRLGAALTDDVSARTITFLPGGGTIDTNGVNLTLANTLGSGAGAFTKAGLGTLSLSAAGTYTGGTTVNAGTLAILANNAIGSGPLTINAGATFDLGTSSVSVGQVTTSGASPVILGSGTITSNVGFAIGHTGDSTIPVILGGTGGLVKTQSNIVTLTGVSTFTGAVDIQAGTLSVASIGSVGGSASALGIPANAANAMIRMGSTTTAAALSYTGAGQTSNRLIGLNGSTGGATISADGTGALILSSGAKAFAAGAKTLTLGGASVSSLNNQIGLIEEYLGTVSVLKSGASTWVLSTSNAYTGSTSVNEGILRLSAAQTLTGALQLGSTATTTTAGTLEVNENAQFGNLVSLTNSATNTNTISIAAGKTLTLTGTVTLGSTTASSTTLLNATGAGSLVVNNTTGTGNTFLVGNNGTSNVANINFGGLSAMNVSLNTTSGVFMVSSSNSNNLTGYATLGLAANSTISASALTVGGGGTYGGNVGQVNQLKLGTGATLLNVGALNIGTGARDLGSITFQDTTGTLTVRGVDGISAAPFNMGTGAAITAVALGGNQNTFDVSGHNADLKFSTVNIGTQNRGADLVNVFSFNQGTLEIGSLTASIKGSNGFTTTSTINIGGGTVTTGAWTLAGTTGAGNAVATANFTGGSLTFSGNILRGAATGAGTVTSTVNLNGATLNMGGMTIGSATNPVTFNPQAGSLSGLAELNGGGAPGAFTKTTTGVLTMGDGNTYTGDTNVNEGTLRLANTSGSATGLGALSTASGTTLSGTGSIAPAVDKNVAVGGGFSIGNVSDIAGSQISISTSGTGAISFNGALYFDLFSGHTSGVDNSATATSADRLVASSSQTFTIGAGATLNLATTIPIDNTWTAGSSWRLFDWSGLTGSEPRITGTFSNLNDTVGNFANLPDLSTYSLGWDVSQLYSQGLISVVVVPEPGRVLLMMLGLLALFMRRRRAE
jgi:autotransporter-associated beta strand protein